MLKSIFVAALLFVAMTLLMAETVFSSPLPEASQSLEKANTEFPEAVNANPDTLKHPEKTIDAKKVDLSKSPKKAPVVSAPRSTYSQPPAPYDYSEIEKFDEEVYGEGK